MCSVQAIAADVPQTQALDCAQGEEGLLQPAGVVGVLEPAVLPTAKLGVLGTLGRDLAVLGQHPLFVLNMLAYCPIQAAFGAFTFWGPKV